jgi:hypothetical protein
LGNLIGIEVTQKRIQQEDFNIQTTIKNELAIADRVLLYDLEIKAGDSVMVNVQKGIIYVCKDKARA